MSNPLNNELLTNSLASFDPSNIDYDALSGINAPGFNDQNGDGIPDHYNQELAPLHTNHRGYIGDDGALYRKEVSISPEGEVSREYTDERLYFWTPPQELGRAPDTVEAQEQAMAGPKGFGAAGLYTEAEIKEAWEADEGMGYLKQHTDWDSYWNFIQKSTELFTDAEYNDMTDGNLSSGNWQESPEYMALLEETGIPTQFVNDDGDVFNFNGTTYVKDYKTDDSIGVEMINAAFLGVVGSAVVGPLIGAALTPALGAAGAKAASSAILSLAKDALTTGELSFGDALLSAGMAYGGEKLVDALKGGGVIDAVGQAEGGDLKSIVDGYAATGKYSQETLDKMYEIAKGAAEDGSNVTDVLGDLQGVIGAVGDAYFENQPDYNVDYGGADPENTDIINNGTQNEDDEFEEDFGVDTEIDMPEITKPEDTDSGGGGSEDSADGGDSSGDTGGDPTVGDGVTETQGQYEVISRNPDGTVTVRDNVDGDVWILEGDYAVGDFIPEEGMVDATRGEGEIDSGDTDESGEDEEIINLPGIEIPGTTPDTSTDTITNPGVDPDGTTTGGDDNTGVDTGGDVTNGTDGDGDVTNEDDGGDVEGDDEGVSIGTGAGTGTGTGTGSGNGSGNGSGDGSGDGSGTGMLAGGGEYTPQWGELFEYTTITPYQAKQLEPVRQYIAKARGMLS